jgi:hypothetical protein
MALYLHLGEFARDLVRRLDAEISLSELRELPEAVAAAASPA